MYFASLFPFVIFAGAVTMAVAELGMLLYSRHPSVRWHNLLGSSWMARGALLFLVPWALYATYAASVRLYDVTFNGLGSMLEELPVDAVGAWYMVWCMARAGKGASHVFPAPPVNALLFFRILGATMILVIISGSLSDLAGRIAVLAGAEAQGYSDSRFLEALDGYAASGTSAVLIWVYGVVIAGIVFAMLRVVFSWDRPVRRLRVLTFQSNQVTKLLLLAIAAPAFVGALLQVSTRALGSEQTSWRHLLLPFQDAILFVFGICLFFLLLREAEIILQSRMQGGSALDTTEAPVAALGA